MNTSKNRNAVKARNTIREMMFVVLVINAITLMLLTATLILMMITLNTSDKIKATTPIVEQEVSEPAKPPVDANPGNSTPDEPVQNTDDEEVVIYSATDEEIELLALVTMAEAEGECEEGKRLVIDTVLNRVDSGRWPNTIHEVVYQPGQFTSMWNGRVDRCRVTEEVRQLVKEELLTRTNSEVVYFTAGGYGRYGIPSFQIGNHYFSTL